MNQSIKFLLSLSLATGILVTTGCSKSSELGLSLVEQEQTDIVYTDTLTVELSTVIADKSQTQQRTQIVAGAYTDPIFGGVEASSYINFRLTRTNPTFANTTLDSVVVSLAYENFGHYGAVQGLNPTPESWDVVRLTSAILEGETYDSDATFSTGSVLKSGFTFTPKYNDSVLVNGVLTAPHLRIKLDDAAGIALGQEFLSPSNPNVYNSNTDFKAWFNGLHFRPTNGANNNSIIRIKASDALTKITIYYTDNSVAGSPVAEVFEFLTDEDSESVSVFEHDYAGTTVLNNTSTDSVVYLQGLDGLQTKIDFPSFNTIGNVIINKADLTVFIADTGTTEYSPIVQLLAKTRDTNGDLFLLDDVGTSLVELNNYLLFGGLLQKTNTTGNQRPFYNMHISQHLQAVVDGRTPEAAIYLTTPSALDASRMQLINHRSPTAKAKLYLTYTKLK